MQRCEPLVLLVLIAAGAWAQAQGNSDPTSPSGSDQSTASDVETATHLQIDSLDDWLDRE
jgi:hypothetical protein